MPSLNVETIDKYIDAFLEPLGPLYIKMISSWASNGSKIIFLGAIGLEIQAFVHLIQVNVLVSFMTRIAEPA